MSKQATSSPKFVFLLCAGLAATGVSGAVVHHQWLVAESKKECPLILRDLAKNCPAVK